LYQCRVVERMFARIGRWKIPCRGQRWLPLHDAPQCAGGNCEKSKGNNGIKHLWFNLCKEQGRDFTVAAGEQYPTSSVTENGVMSLS